MSRSRVLGADAARAIAVTAVLTASLGCPEPPDPVIEDPPDASRLPGRYVAHAAGLVELSGDGVEPAKVNGRMRASYVVYPDARVVVTSLAAKFDDVDLVVPFLWWELDREPLRCTSLTTLKTAVGSLTDSEIKLAPETVSLAGISYSTKKGPSVCTGDTRGLVATNPTPLTLGHNPDANQFSVSGTFAASQEGNEFLVTLDFDGDFSNRPPVVRLSHGNLDADDGELVDGCPDPKSIANSERGLVLRLLSKSEDPDPHGVADSNLKFPRADLQREDWVRSVGDKFVFLGEGRQVDEVIFEGGRDHVLQLTVTDHSGSRARKICEFHVSEG